MSMVKIRSLFLMDASSSFDLYTECVRRDVQYYKGTTSAQSTTDGSL